MARRKETYGITQQAILDVLMRDDTVGMHAIGRALQALRRRQTFDELQSEETKHDNGRGFTPADAKRGTSMANFYTDRGYLTEKQRNYWRRPAINGVPRICKYWSQLLEEARHKAAAKIAGIDPGELAVMRMEAEADREGTIRDERNKHEARSAMEGRSYASIRH
jgi:hypothetical protein